MQIGKTNAIGNRINHHLATVQPQSLAGCRGHRSGAGSTDGPDIVRVQADEGIGRRPANHGIDIDVPLAQLDLERRGKAGIVERVDAVASAVNHSGNRGLIGVGKTIAQCPADQTLDICERQQAIERAAVLAGDSPLVVAISGHEEVAVDASVE